ncbi:MAG: decarboxylating 6-phosphogluconate dehydrogenase [Chloroflexi bacterium]|nr:decarboxylating 6-phosphogluconate dehydrogenase [Chloroflexota bacterium]MBV9894340.1 decarboxylating 6-phosphogluconate dehydrogenase [Chloroflexota bacterium]
MELGMIGLGRMGGNMVVRLMRKQHRVIGYDRSADAVKGIQAQGATGADSLAKLMSSFESKPRVVWVMLPAGKPTSDTIKQLADLGDKGDIIIDGGNTNWRDVASDAELVQSKGMHYMDAGTSGGVWGLEYGYCLMVGGEQDVFEHCKPLLTALAPDDGGLVYTGPAGSGHFVKMVHNGIEYAMMQAYAEGFNLMKRSAYPDMDLQAVAEAWRHGSVVRSWLLDLLADGLDKDPDLSKLKGYVEDTGEGRWTVDTAIDCAVPTPVIALALFERFRSREDNSFADRVLAMLRNQFGGHAVQTA